MSNENTIKKYVYKDVLNAKILTLIEHGRVEISSKEELEKYPIGSLISYTKHNNNDLTQGGFVTKFSDGYFIYITLDFSKKYRARYAHIDKMWVGDIYKVRNDIVSLSETTQKKTNIPVKIGDIIIYYAANNFDYKRFVGTNRYKNALAWYNYFVNNNHEIV